MPNQKPSYAFLERLRAIQGTKHWRAVMRDPARIDEILKTLREIWLKQPDLRLGQIVVIAAGPKEPQIEIFNIEDDKLLAGLLEYQELTRKS